MSSTNEELKLLITGDSTGGQQSIADLTTQLKEAQQAVSDIQAAFAGVGPGTNAGQVFADQMAAAKQTVADLEEQLKTAKQGVDDTTLSWQQLGTTLTSASTALHSAGMILTAALTAPLVGAAAAGESFAADFETNMTRVQTLAGASADEVKGLTQSILDLAPSVGVAPAELAKGLFVVESAGYRGAEAMSTLTTAAKMSALGMGDTESVTRSLVGAMLSYKEQNLSAAEAGDILVKTVQLGNMKIDELVPALARVNPVAAAMGIHFQDVGAAIATFTHMGASSDVAATGLRAMLSNILNDSAKTEKGFLLLSQTLGDSTVSMANFRKEIQEKGLTIALLDLMEKANAAGEKGVDALNKIFPNVRALTEVLAIAKANGENYRSIAEQIYASSGVLEQGFRRTQETFNQEWARFKAQADVLWVTLGDALLPTFKMVVDFIANDAMPVVKMVVDLFAEMPPSLQTLVVALGALLAAVGPVVYILGTLAGAAGQLITLSVRLAGMEGLGTLAYSFGTAAAAVAPFAIAIGAGGALGTAIGWLLEQIPLVRRAVDDVFRGVMRLAAGPGKDVSYQEHQAGLDALRLASERAGRAITDMSEAMRVNDDWVKQHNASVKAAEDAHLALTSSVHEAAHAHQTLLERVQALTPAQKADIDSKREHGYSVKAISEETKIATDVISAYLKQVHAVATAHKDAAKAEKEHLAELEANIDYYRRLSVNAAASTVLGPQTLLKQMADAIKKGVAFEGGAESLIPKIISGGIFQQTAGIGKGMETIGGIAGLMPDFSNSTYSATLPAETSLSFAQEFGKSLETDIPDAIIKAFEGGGDVLKSVGAVIGKNFAKDFTDQFIGTDNYGGMRGKIFGFMGGDSNEDGTFGGLLKGGLTTLATGGMASLASMGFGLLEKGLGALFNLGGPSKEELQGRQVESGFEKSFGSFDQMMAAVGKAYEATGRSAQQAQADVKALMDAEKQGGDAAKAAIDKINGAFTEQKQDAQELQAAIQRYGFSIQELGPALQKQRLDEQAQQLLNDWRLLVGAGIDITTVDDKMAKSVQNYLTLAKQTGQEVPIAMQPILQKMIEEGKLTDENGHKITDMKQLGVNFSETMTQGFDRIVERLDALLQKLGIGLPNALAKAVNDASSAASKISSDWDQVSKAVDRVNFGTSPGGLKEIPLLLDKSIAASAAAAARMTTNLGAIYQTLPGSASGGGSPVSITINAIDGASVKALIERPDFQTTFLQTVARDGRGFGTKLGRALPRTT